MGAKEEPGGSKGMEQVFPQEEKLTSVDVKRFVQGHRRHTVKAGLSQLSKSKFHVTEWYRWEGRNKPERRGGGAARGTATRSGHSTHFTQVAFGETF